MPDSGVPRLPPRASLPARSRACVSPSSCSGLLATKGDAASSNPSPRREAGVAGVPASMWLPGVRGQGGGHVHSFPSSPPCPSVTLAAAATAAARAPAGDTKPPCGDASARRARRAGYTGGDPTPGASARTTERCGVTGGRPAEAAAAGVAATGVAAAAWRGVRAGVAVAPAVAAAAAEAEHRGGAVAATGVVATMRETEARKRLDHVWPASCCASALERREVALSTVAPPMLRLPPVDRRARG